MSYNPSQIAFAPLGPTITITANVSAPAAQQAPVSAGNQSVGQYRILNTGAATVLLGVGNTAAEAQTNAASAATAVPLLSGATEVLRFGTGSYFSATAGSATTIYIVPGQGL